MEPKRTYTYHADIDDIIRGIIGPYMMSHRRPIKLGDIVVLEIYPHFEDPMEDYEWTSSNPPEYLVLAKVHKIDDIDVWFKVSYDTLGESVK